MGIFKNEFSGIYFGPKAASFVLVSGGKISNWLVTPYPIAQTADHAVEDILEVFKGREMEQIAFLQKSIRESKIETKNVVISLPPKDLIIRFFEMPNIPHNEIAAGINFEIKKYIPFKIEELAYDYQYKIRSKSNIIEVMLCGMKQAPLEAYSKLLEQVGLPSQFFEPGLFSLFRLLVIKKKISSQKSYIVLEFNKESANILILEKGFPYFTRDIRLTPVPGRSEEPDNQVFRLVNEVRVSLDYYRRQFLKKEVDEMLLISTSAAAGCIEQFKKELGLKVEPLSLEELVGVDVPDKEMLPDLAKAYGAALRTEKPSLITLNLGARKDKQRSSAIKPGMSSEEMQEAVVTFVKENKPALIQGCILGVIILLIGYGIGFSKLFPLEKEKAAASIQTLPILPGVDLSTLESIQASETALLVKEKDWKKLKDKGLFYKKLLSLSRLTPKGVWFTNLSYSDGDLLSLYCYSYHSSEKVRAENMNVFITNLKKDPDFSKAYASIELKSWHEEQMQGHIVIAFDVLCLNKPQ